MHHNSKIAVIAILAVPLVKSQDLSGLPSCATEPVLASIGKTGCALMDFACSCSNTAFLATLQSEIASVCSPADYAAALAMASSTCRSAGVTISLAPATTGTTAVTAAVLAPMTPATSAGSPQVSTFAAVDSDTSGSTSTGIYSQTYSGQLQSATGVSNIASNLTNSSSIVPFTGSASSFQVQGISVGVLIGAVGVFFAFQ